MTIIAGAEPLVYAGATLSISLRGWLGPKMPRQASRRRRGKRIERYAHAHIRNSL